MQPVSPAISGWKAITSILSWRAATGWPSTEARISTASPCSATHGRADEDGADRRPRRRPGISRSASNERTWRPNALRCAGHVHHAEVLAVEHDHPRAGAEHGHAGRDELAQRVGQPLALDPERHRRRLAAGDDEPVEPVEVGRARAPRAPRRRAPRSIRAWASKSPCRASTPTRAARATSRGWRAAATPRACASRATPSPCRGPRTRARRARGPGSASSPRRSRPRAAAGSSDLKMPEPTNTPSAPSCIISDGVGRGGDARRRRTARPAACRPAATSRTRSNGAACSLAAVASSDVVEHRQALDLAA